MLLFELDAFPIEQLPDVEAFERRMGGWIAGRTYPVRLLAFSRPFDMAPPAQRLRSRRHALGDLRDLRAAMMPTLYRLLHGDRAALATLPALAAGLAGQGRAALERLCMALLPSIVIDPESTTEAEWLLFGELLEQRTWTLPFLRDLELFYADLAERHLRSATYVLVVWPPDEVQALEVLTSLRAATGREVRQIEQLPPVLRAAVTVDEGQAILRPQEAGQPYLSVLRSYDITGEIDAGLLHGLMGLPFDVTIAVDVETLPLAKARRLAEFAYQAARAATADARVKDVRSEDKQQDAERVMRELRTQGFHAVQVSVLVSGESEEELRQRRAAVRDLLGSTVRLEAVRGSQAELLKLFSTTPAAHIDGAWARSTMLSHGVGCLFGLLGYYRATSTEGPLWGTDAFRLAPLFYNTFQGGRAGHMVVLGQTGSGKTYFLNVMTLRIAAALGWRVIWIDSNENGPRLERACKDGLRRHEVGLSSTLNLLDPVYGPTDGAHWRLSQAQYVTSALALLMGTPVLEGGEAASLMPRVFSAEERGYLERALLALYQEMPVDPSPDEVPILTDLILTLEALGEPIAAALARTLRVLLFGSETRTDTQTVRGACFNGRTTVSWEIAGDIVFFDLTQSDATGKELLPFFYAEIIGFVYRYMRDGARDRRRPTLLIVDEFGLASKIEAVGQLAATITKVARKYRLALVCADQNPHTFLTREFGRTILDNSPAKIMFHMDDKPTREIGEALPILTAGHLQFIREADQGFCVAVFGNTVTSMAVESTNQERALLSGS